MKVDARGLSCPKPVMMTDEAISKADPGVIEVLVDDSTAADNVAWFAGQKGMHADVSKENGYFRITLIKPESAIKKAALSEGETPKKSLFLIVATDTMGKEEALGRTLMKAYFETMKTYRQLPDSIFFLNAGIKLTTTDAEIFGILKEIEEMGVEIFSCGTCLKYYDLESELKVGHRGTTTLIVEGMKDFEKTVWIG